MSTSRTEQATFPALPSPDRLLYEHRSDPTVLYLVRQLGGDMVEMVRYRPGEANDTPVVVDRGTLEDNYRKRRKVTRR